MSQFPHAAALSRLTFDTWALGIEAASVMWLRGFVMMAGGNKAEDEAQRMVWEKVTAAATLWPAMMTGTALATPETLGARALRHYAKPVRANRRRLLRTA